MVTDIDAEAYRKALGQADTALAWKVARWVTAHQRHLSAADLMRLSFVFAEAENVMNRHGEQGPCPNVDPDEPVGDFDRCPACDLDETQCRSSLAGCCADCAHRRAEKSAPRSDTSARIIQFPRRSA